MAPMDRDDIHPIRVPQLDVNDQEMELLSWSVEHGDEVTRGQVLCVLETAKASFDLAAEHHGVVARFVEEGSTVRVGQHLGAIGRDLDVIAAAAGDSVRESPQDAAPAARDLRVTNKAAALADAHGIDTSRVPHKGGIVKEKDVRRFLEQTSTPSADRAAPPTTDEAPLPGWLAELLLDAEPRTRHRAAVGRQLAETQRAVVAAQVETEVRLEAADRIVKAAGGQTSLFHLVMGHAARHLRAFPLLKTLNSGDALHSYRDCDLSFTLSGPDRKLFTPVVRQADTLDLESIVLRCAELSLAAFRDELTKDQLMGGCFTVSALTGLEVTRFAALQNQYQSAALAIGAPRTTLVLSADGTPAEARVAALVLTYDHAVCDGYYAGEFLTALKRSLEQEPALG